MHPYVLLNYTRARRDVLTLAHELGHGLHASLARDRGVLEQHTPLTLAETASVFGETLVFAPAARPGRRRRSRGSRCWPRSIEGSIATVFRQAAMNRFEDLVAHRAARGGRAVGRPHRRAVAASPRRELLGDAVEVTDGYRIVVVLRPPLHRDARATSTPTPTASCSRCRSTARYLEEGEAFVPRYLELLSAGGSRSPEELGAIAGLDLADPGFWDRGLDLVRDQLEQAEAAAEDRCWRKRRGPEPLGNPPARRPRAALLSAWRALRPVASLFAARFRVCGRFPTVLPPVKSAGGITPHSP